jgi:hypothetical protein
MRPGVRRTRERRNVPKIARQRLVELRHTRTTMAKVNVQVKMVNTHTSRLRLKNELPGSW